jgi:L-lactate dehydrogenase complex protein LldG
MPPGPKQKHKGSTLGREEILKRIRTALGDRQRSDADEAALAERIAARPAGPKVHLDSDLLSTFFAKAAANNFTIERVASLQMLPPAVRALLPRDETPDISVAPALSPVEWPSDWRITRGAGRPVEHLSVTPALAGIAETGSVVLASGPDSPTSLNFLPDLHVVVLRASDIVAHPEDVWRRMQRETWPRTVNVISGPSRTADVGGIIVRPAHGPKRVHLVIVDA